MFYARHHVNPPPLTLGVAYEMNKVTDLKQIMALGVIATPALVIDGNLKVAGRSPSVDEIKRMLV